MREYTREKGKRTSTRTCTADAASRTWSNLCCFLNLWDNGLTVTGGCIRVGVFHPLGETCFDLALRSVVVSHCLSSVPHVCSVKIPNGFKTKRITNQINCSPRKSTPRPCRSRTKLRYSVISQENACRHTDLRFALCELARIF